MKKKIIKYQIMKLQKFSFSKGFNIKKYSLNIVIILLCASILVIYHYHDIEKKAERFWIKKSRAVFDIINYIKVILRLSLFFNIKFILLGFLQELSIL
jgi:hypothetical protein